MSDSIWTEKGTTLSDKSAYKQFGLAHEEIINLIKTGRLQYRINNMHGNPYFKLIRSEVEAYVTEKFGKDYLRNKKLKSELAQINKRLRKLKTELKSLDYRKRELLEDIQEEK